METDFKNYIGRRVLIHEYKKTHKGFVESVGSISLILVSRGYRYSSRKVIPFVSIISIRTITKTGSKFNPMRELKPKRFFYG